MSLGGGSYRAGGKIGGGRGGYRGDNPHSKDTLGGVNLSVTKTADVELKSVRCKPLGSGKTTVMRHVLANRQELKVACAVNGGGLHSSTSQLSLSRFWSLKR